MSTLLRGTVNNLIMTCFILYFCATSSGQGEQDEEDARVVAICVYRGRETVSYFPPYIGLGDRFTKTVAAHTAY